nr:hypothetical protein GCM10020092_075940 [Actinoplanes digitatis]
MTPGPAPAMTDGASVYWIVGVHGTCGGIVKVTGVNWSAGISRGARGGERGPGRVVRRVLVEPAQLLIQRRGGEQGAGALPGRGVPVHPRHGGAVVVRGRARRGGHLDGGG